MSKPTLDQWIYKKTKPAETQVQLEMINRTLVHAGNNSVHTGRGSAKSSYLDCGSCRNCLLRLPA